MPKVDFCFTCEVQSLAVAKDVGLNVDLNSLFRHSELRKGSRMHQNRPRFTYVIYVKKTVQFI